ncbi:hypothetical protein FOCC_FOCC014546 [Frankliniella occidentalis]|nr:hypothetical protein FOCC_FOCC014546 [Frankliniella occidentalis]
MAPIGQLPQPFLEPDRVPKPTDRDKDVATIRAWVNTQTHLPPLTGEHRESSLAKALSNSSAMRAYGELVACPERTKEGYGVLLYRLTDFDPSHVDLLQGMKSFFAFNDVRLSEDGVIPGYVVVFDMRGITLSHLAIVTLSGIRKFMHYIQECHPCRLKAIHVINTVKWFDKILTIIKPFVKSELLQMLSMHGEDLSTMFKTIPQSVLPADYGGKAPLCKELHDAHVKLMVDKYTLWLKQEESLRECHPCRLKAIHVINTVKWFDKILTIIKPFVKSELLQMLSMHGEDLSTMFKTIPQSVLPADYGGKAPLCKELHDAHVKLMVDKYTLWLKQEESLRVDEKKRPDKCKIPKFNTMEGSFRSLAID